MTLGGGADGSRWKEWANGDNSSPKLFREEKGEYVGEK